MIISTNQIVYTELQTTKLPHYISSNMKEVAKEGK